MKKTIIFGLVLVFTFFVVVGCAPIESNEQSNEQNNDEVITEEINTVDWKSVELTDVRTGEQFTVSDFDVPVLLESFAVWCPTCTKQQNIIKELHQEVGDTVVSISLDTDPNEDEAQILEHITRNDFDWRYAVSPSDMVKSLIAEFGVGVVNAPRAPVVLVCPDNTARFLPGGVKDVEELQDEIANGC